MSADKAPTSEVPSNGLSALAEQTTEGMLGPNPFVGLRAEDIVASFRAIGEQAVRNPTLVVEQEAALIRDLISVMSGQSELAPPKGDKRFGDRAWQESTLYRMVMQGYVAWTNALQGFVDRSELDDRTKNRARFAVSLMTDALAPTNTLLGNPAALRKTWDERGQNLVNGLKNLVDDINNNGGLPAQVDKKAFAVGGNLALSPGSVVFRNAVVELIQYSPATDTVYERPHLIVPPEINKFYVFDLSPGKSMVEYLVGHGLQVFAVSWRNPTSEHRDWGMDTYVSALQEALAAVREITGSPDLIIHAACSGAMTAAALAGYLAASEDNSIYAMAMMVAVLGQVSEGTLSLFATNETTSAAKLKSQIVGVLDGLEMNRIFAWLRPNDLVWFEAGGRLVALLTSREKTAMSPIISFFVVHPDQKFNGKTSGSFRQRASPMIWVAAIGAIAIVNQREDAATDRDPRLARMAGLFPGGAVRSDLGGLLDVKSFSGLVVFESRAL